MPKVFSESRVTAPVTYDEAPAPAVATPPNVKLVAARVALLVTLMSLPVALVSVIPVPAAFSFAVTPVCELLSLNALMAEARPSALLAAPDVKETVTAVLLSETTERL